ncbi:MAG TPA: tetratricopeptide repeat protein [Terriglobales bacterium]|jgi:cytochrome c-type biogenesis protein CcmH/NrfG|nr:tetratricopeptide repeat protein [Terriglobales bacterium]
MTDQSQQPPAATAWTAAQVYITAAICLGLGITLGYLFRGSERQASAVSTSAPVQAASNPATPSMPTIDQMKHMAEKQAEPLIAQVEKDPKNADLLAKVGRIYESTHQFKEAADYFQKSLALKPDNVALRNEMASCLYYTGDVDGALKEFERSLKDDPKNPNSLFNMGMIRWRGKNDAAGAVSAWQELLKLNPSLDDQKKAEVKQMIADASQHAGMPQGEKPKF